MKTVILSIAAALALSTTAKADPTYIIIKKRFFKVTMRYVKRPKENKLRKWYYDADKDTYYRARTFLGIVGVPIIVKGNFRRSGAPVAPLYEAPPVAAAMQYQAPAAPVPPVINNITQNANPVINSDRTDHNNYGGGDHSQRRRHYYNPAPIYQAPPPVQYFPVSRPSYIPYKY